MGWAERQVKLRKTEQDEELLMDAKDLKEHIAFDRRMAKIGLQKVNNLIRSFDGQ